MEKSERNVLLTVGAITLCLLAVFWWLGDLASKKEITEHREEESARPSESYLATV